MSDITNICIVGGGTAGWSAVAALSVNKKLRITVVESSKIPTIGVGESTIPYINDFHKQTGFEVFDNLDWLDEVDGVVKLSIAFNGFDGSEHKWYHPFFDNKLDTEKATSYLFNKEVLESDFVLNEIALCKQLECKFTTNVEWAKTSMSGSHAAYHFDAGMYSNLLKRESLKRSNVTHIDALVENITLDSEGNISTITLDSGETVQAELYIDCTGFKALLTEKVGNPWVDISDRLLVDSALVVQVPYIDKAVQLKNATTCTALSSGWSWNIPLQSRIGTGYIYSSKYTTQEAAEKEFKQYLYDTFGYENLDIRKMVEFKTGFRENAWHKNVVSIGLSGFFAEPIESTAIAAYHGYVTKLSELLINNHLSANIQRDKFNTHTASCVKSVVEFAEAHYTLSMRNDTPFWQYYCSRPYAAILRKLLNSYLGNSLDEFSDSYINKVFEGFSTFSMSSYRLMFYGYGYIPNSKVKLSK